MDEATADARPAEDGPHLGFREATPALVHMGLRDRLDRGGTRDLDPLRERPQARLAVHPGRKVRHAARFAVRGKDLARVPKREEEPLAGDPARVSIVRLDVSPPEPEVLGPRRPLEER